MYTLYGLKLIAEKNKAMIPSGYVKEALANAKESLTVLTKSVRLFQTEFGKDVAIDITPFETAIAHFEKVANTQREVKKEVFLAAYQLAVEANEQERKVNTSLYEQFDHVQFRKTEPTYFVLNPGSVSFHKLGFFNYATEQFITTYYESEDHYKGIYWGGHFFDVIFKKADVRLLTEEEKKQATIR